MRVIFAALLIVALPAVLAQETYPINWDLVLTSEGVPLVIENTDLGPCICDLTFDECDVNCYCDPDCTATATQQFSAELNEGPVEFDVKTCVNSNLMDVNARGGISSNLAENLLCIAVNNNPSQGFFYDSPLSIEETTYESLHNDATYTYTNGYTFRAATTAYKAGQVVGAAVAADDGSLYLENRGRFSVPAPGFSPYCDEKNAPEYLMPRSESCYRYSNADFAATCTGNSTSFSPSSYLRQVVAKLPQSDPAVAAEFVSIELRTLTYVTDAGIVTVSNNATNTTSNATASVALDPSDIPDLSYNASTCTCDNVVSEVKFTIVYLQDGAISNVLADMVVTTVTGENGCQFPRFEQTFETEFVETDADGGALAEQGVPKSGNPGYLTGYPILAGKAEVSPDDDTVMGISQYVDGFQILAPDANGECSVSSAGGTTTVNFGEDMVVGCNVMMTAAELEALCTTTEPVTYLPVDTDLMFGTWGSSSLYDQWSWNELVTDEPTYIALWQPNHRQCVDIIDTVNIEVIWANFGSVDNPQAGIIQIRQSFSTGDWQFKGSDATVAEAFPVRATVQHLYYQAEAQSEYLPPAPPIIPKFPRDTLYPLYVPSAE